MSDAHSIERMLVTGATGYIGGRLVPRLLEAGYRVRCLVREPRKLEARPWFGDERLEIVTGNAEDSASLVAAMAGCDAAYYLIHSMMVAGAEYRAKDRALAEGFAPAAAKSAVQRIIYLGGMGETGSGLSEHLASRQEVESALASTEVPLTVFRAAMIIGSGSASFEILRYLVERLPIMVTPRWVKTESQPIAVRNVLHYLVACLDCPDTVGHTFDIGGADVMTYKEIMQIMAEARGLHRRVILPVPVLTPRLSSLWIHLVTPLSSKIARPLAEGLRNRVVCQNNDAARLMPQELFGVREAIQRAMGKARTHAIETSWSDAGPMPGDPDWSGGQVFIDQRDILIDADSDAVYRAVCRIGGAHGYYAADWLWRIRGWMDRFVGGPGLRRGRRNPENVGFGDALDFWRVTGIERNRHLRLRAEMKLPGEAELTFDIESLDDAAPRTRLTQTARFRPKGLIGIAYWCSVLPLHGIVFTGMLNGIKRTAQQLMNEDVPVPSAID